MLLRSLALFTTLFAGMLAWGEQPPIVFEDNFDNGTENWQFTDHGEEFGDAPSVWQVVEGAGRGGSHLRVTGKSTYKPPFRSPHSIAWLTGYNVGSFQMDVRVQSTNHSAGPHRDLCLFWGRQDPAHFYYVHLGAKADPHACQIFVVDGAARKAITTETADGTPWTNGWHDVRVTFDAETGATHVYFDELTQPLMSAQDNRFRSGQVGLGTFDDHGNFDDFVLRRK